MKRSALGPVWHPWIRMRRGQRFATMRSGTTYRIHDDGSYRHLTKLDMKNITSPKDREDTIAKLQAEATKLAPSSKRP